MWQLTSRKNLSHIKSLNLRGGNPSCGPNPEPQIVRRTNSNWVFRSNTYTERGQIYQVYRQISQQNAIQPYKAEAWGCHHPKLMTLASSVEMEAKFAIELASYKYSSETQVVIYL